MLRSLFSGKMFRIRPVFDICLRARSTSIPSHPFVKSSVHFYQFLSYPYVSKGFQCLGFLTGTPGYLGHHLLTLLLPQDKQGWCSTHARTSLHGADCSDCWTSQRRPKPRLQAAGVHPNHCGVTPEGRIHSGQSTHRSLGEDGIRDLLLPICCRPVNFSFNPQLVCCLLMITFITLLPLYVMVLRTKTKSHIPVLPGRYVTVFANNETKNEFL